MAMLTRNDCLTTLTLEGASFAGAMKVEEKERNKRSRKSEVTGSNALKPSTRANKQRQQNIAQKKRRRYNCKTKNKESGNETRVS